ncbi:UPF0182 family protein [Cyanobacterium aponinum UTEX 3222]|uniref:UPF0182 family protein n=1 Tax=Cyanobacterium aponinum TaxID=379064 RepID=UPI002B4BC873|nr:UPF0182 family protein [Cyanobacterium aponinum]WRL37315.1 UPF0182 family protein [Cyanobacterium aponinum UTEX 3221]WRL43673.1 UPF0182 family protein [Cyanobacterium aponinum UTEX 3222]
MKTIKSPFNILFFAVFSLLIIWIILLLISYFTVNVLWFEELGYPQTFFTQFLSKFTIGGLAFIISTSFLWFNLAIASRQRKQQEQFFAKGKDKLTPQSPPLKLRLLLPIVISFSGLISLTLFYYTKFFTQISGASLLLPNLRSPSSLPLQLAIFTDIANNLPLRIWQIILIILVTLFLIFKPRQCFKFICIYFSIITSLIIGDYWSRFLHYFYSINLGKTDPIFNIDLSFYLFKIPALQILALWLQSLFIFTICTVTLTYLLSNKSISEGKFEGFSRYQLRHLYGLGGGLMIILGGIHWLNRYLLLLSPDGVVYGAGYTDIHINLPRETIATAYALLMGIWLLTKSFTGSGKRNHPHLQAEKKYSLPFSTLPFIGYFVLYSFGILLAVMVQNTIVQPNELALETPYIINNIKATRSAFNLDEIEVKTFNPEGNLTAEDIKKNHLTIDNIRLWDTRPILQANRQLQQIRPYYVFADADIDRYQLKSSINSDINENTQVILAPRELDSQLLPNQAQTWVNQHLVYTHGYGFTMSPVNRVAQGGLPYYFIKDIGTAQDPGELNTSSARIRESIPFSRPRIYYGEVTKNYVMVDTKVPEFDFPSGEDNVYHTYTGDGGIKIDSFWRKFIFSVYLRDWRMLLTPNFTPDTRILFRRNLTERLGAIAPFLYYDRDPYLVIAQTNPEDKNSLHWLIDGYTISDHYPYSDGGENQFNYIRNSVKVLINAENGNTHFYVSDSTDRIIQVWQKIFPELFKPLSAMPPTIKQHIRYPTDLFNTQSERLLTYHMIDPQVFYNREDQWQVPEEIYGNEILSMQPYYLIMKLPIGKQEEFILLHPYTPISRANLIAWLAARSDGENYGKLLLYQFPKQKLIYGPDQVEALINQDPVISGQISLWNRQGSKAVQGHLLIIPIEQSLLYVEPVYLEADKNSVPTLARVIVVYQNKIVMADSLENAIDNIFSDGKEDSSAIIRLLEDAAIPLLEPNLNNTNQ